MVIPKSWFLQDIPLRSIVIWVLVFIFVSFFYMLFSLIRSAFIDPETCTQVCLQIVCGPYPNRTYISDSPAGLWKVMSRVPVVCSDLSTSIDCVPWSKTSFNLLVQAFFFFVAELCLLHLLYQRSLILRLVLKCVRKISVFYIQIRHTALLLLQVCGSPWRGCRLCDCTCHR